MNCNSSFLDKTESLAYIGQEFKNFKEYCNYFNIPISNNPCSNTRNSIMKKSEEFFGLEKQGHKIIIKEIKKHPTSFEQLWRDKSLFDDLFEKQILLLLKNVKSRSVDFLKTDFWRRVGLVNNQYKYIYDYDELVKKAKRESKTVPPKWMVDHFYHRTYSINDRKVKQTLNHLQNKGLIVFQEVLFKAEYNGEHSQVIDADEISFIQDCRIKAKHDTVGKYRKDELENYIKDEFGNRIETTFQDVHKNYCIYQQYKEHQNKRLAKRGIKYTYKKYRITLCGEQFTEDVDEDNLQSLCLKVNNRICKIVDKEADNNQVNKYPRCHNYADIQKWLSKQLIAIDKDVCKTDEKEEKYEICK